LVGSRKRNFRFMRALGLRSKSNR